MQSAEVADRGGDGIAESGLVGHITGESETRSTRAFDEVTGFLVLRRTPRVDRNVRALARKAQRRRETDAGICAGYEEGSPVHRGRLRWWAHRCKYSGPLTARSSRRVRW